MSMPALDPRNAWTNAFLATALISFIPNVILVFMPQPSSVDPAEAKGKPKWSLTKLLLCFAVGALLGDVFLHALPHLLTEHHHHGAHEDHEDHHDHHELDHHGHGAHDHGSHGHAAERCAAPDAAKLLLGYDRTMMIELAVLLGFLIFFAVEKTAIYVLGHHAHAHGAESTGPDAAMCPFAKANPGAAMPDNHPAGQQHPQPKEQLKEQPGLRAPGWLNLFADSLHNFTDGLAVGAAFSAGKGLALATFLSVLLHELPHEIADYSILVQNGLTKWQAIRMQFVTALAAFAGTAVGLLAMRNETLETLLLASTSGGFLYVATVSVLPEVTQSKSTGTQLLAEMAAFCGGVGLMALMVLTE